MIGRTNASATTAEGGLELEYVAMHEDTADNSRFYLLMLYDDQPIGIEVTDSDDNVLTFNNVVYVDRQGFYPYQINGAFTPLEGGYSFPNNTLVKRIDGSGNVTYEYNEDEVTITSEPFPGFVDKILSGEMEIVPRSGSILVDVYVMGDSGSGALLSVDEIADYVPFTLDTIPSYDFEKIYTTTVKIGETFRASSSAIYPVAIGKNSTQPSSPVSSDVAITVESADTRYNVGVWFEMRA